MSVPGPRLTLVQADEPVLLFRDDPSPRAIETDNFGCRQGGQCEFGSSVLREGPASLKGSISSDHYR